MGKLSDQCSRLDRQIWNRTPIEVDPASLNPDLVVYRNTRSRWTIRLPVLVRGNDLIAGYRRWQVAYHRSHKLKAIDISDIPEQQIPLVQLYDAIRYDALSYMDSAKALTKFYGPTKGSKIQFYRQIANQSGLPTYFVRALYRLAGATRKYRKFLEQYDDRITFKDFGILMGLNSASLRKYFVRQRCQRRKLVHYAHRTEPNVQKKIIQSMREIGYANYISRALMWCIYALPDEEIDHDIQELKRTFEQS